MGPNTGQTDGLDGSRLRNEQWGWNLAVKSEDSIHVVREVYQFSKLLMQIFFISNRMLNILFNAMTLLYLTLSASFHIVQFIIANAIRMQVVSKLLHWLQVKEQSQGIQLLLVVQDDIVQNGEQRDPTLHQQEIKTTTSLANQEITPHTQRF